VTRIVSGIAKGRRLEVPARGTRPTSDRAREALFSSLTVLLDLQGARVLDLFAGTGAVGLEALSRGAAQAAFVESARSAASVLQANIDALGLPGAVVHRCSVESFLAATAGERPFDLVFADPPYALGDSELAAILQVLSAESRWLAAEAVVVVERPARGGPPPWPDVIQPIKDRRYGEGVLWYGRRGQTARGPGDDR
jgi:16S rRNA (guanine966-N2)-methyltransferase